MIRLENSEVLKRRIRQDDPLDLAIPTWNLIREAIKAGRGDEALDFLEYGCGESKLMHDSAIWSYEAALTKIASFGGEEEIEKFHRERYCPTVENWLSTTPGVEESLQRSMEFQRGHHGGFTIVEKSDRYVVKLEPCGSGGRLRRTRSVGTTKKAYPWSWNKVGVPYYCCHCCLFWEIIPMEVRGYPIRIVLVGDKPEDPCTLLFYKKPELIPDEYFTRIGMNRAKYRAMLGAY